MFCSTVDWESHGSMKAKLFIRFLGVNASLKRHPLENALFWMLPQTLVKRETITWSDKEPVFGGGERSRRSWFGVAVRVLASY